MERIRVVAGEGVGPTATAAYDAALLDAGVGNHNLVTVSSVVPPGATVEVPEAVPTLGETGDRLTVVQARAVGERAAAALSWARTAGGEGLFYEGSATSPDGADADLASLRGRALRVAERGLTAGFDARDWEPTDRASLTATATVSGTERDTAVATDDAGVSEPAASREDEAGPLAAAVVLAVYGEGRAPF